MAGHIEQEFQDFLKASFIGQVSGEQHWALRAAFYGGAIIAAAATVDLRPEFNAYLMELTEKAIASRKGVPDA